MKLTVAQLLNGAADQIEPSGTWSKHFTARRPPDQKGVEGDQACLATDRRATHWGALGAIFKVGMAAGLRTVDCYSAGRIAEQHIGCDHLTSWAAGPDVRQSDVVAGLRKAAQAETARAA